MIADCPVCGKGFEILWPQLWAYKEGNTYFCTWKCLQTMRKGAKDIMKMKKDGTPAKKPGPKPKIETPEAAIAAKPAVTIPKAETPETPAVKPEKTPTYTVTGIRTERFGEFYFDRKFNSIDWRTEEGDEIGMSPQAWIDFRKELPAILKALGVSL